jgi:hypothetical protein
MKSTARTPGTPSIGISKNAFPGDTGALAVQNHILSEIASLR